ncbi:hypothetical protein D3C83_21780 [compost metagenome]
MQHRLGEPVREHLERDQHPDGEFLAGHHQPRPDAQDNQRQQLLQHIGGDVVGIGQLLGAEPGPQISCQVVPETLAKLWLHLQ